MNVDIQFFGGRMVCEDAMKKDKQDPKKKKAKCKDCGKFTNGNEYCQEHMIDRSFSSPGSGCY